MADAFHDALKVVLDFEGGKVDNPNDPGGRTAFGITQAVYNGWRSQHHLAPQDVFKITNSELEVIYQSQYWTPCRAGDMPNGVGLVVFDGAVLAGVAQSVKWLQRALGFAPDHVDGIVGVKTLSALRAVTDTNKLIAGIIARREIFLRALKTFKTFGRGWINRAEQVKVIAQAMASGIPYTITPTGSVGTAKAVLADAKDAPSTAYGDSIVGVGGGQTIFSQITDQLQPVAIIPFIRDALPYITLAGIIIAAIGFTWRYYAMKRKQQLADALDTTVK